MYWRYLVHVRLQGMVQYHAYPIYQDGRTLVHQHLAQGVQSACWKHLAMHGVLDASRPEPLDVCYR